MSDLPPGTVCSYGPGGPLPPEDAAVVEAFAASLTDGRPRTPDRERHDDDVNPICGHRRRSLCLSCGTCVDCDGCYCGED